MCRDMSELNHQSKQLASISSSLQEEKRDLVRECRGKARALEQNASYIAELEEQLRLCREETKARFGAPKLCASFLFAYSLVPLNVDMYSFCGSCCVSRCLLECVLLWF